MPYKDPAQQAEAVRRYKASAKGLAARRAYDSRPEVKAKRRAADQTPSARERRYHRVRTERYKVNARASKQRAREIARKAADEYKLSRGCIDCGYKEHPAALHFDHIDPSEKSCDVASLIGTGRIWATILIEAQKCEIRCANCHAVKTWSR
jgi:hypothetical protein